jgi:3-hydroxyacyl-[acyl-carrier-protein] dehydratase
VTPEGQDPVALGLPHRAPFLFVDTVTELVPGERAFAAKTFAPEDPMFAGHFPGNPVIPGVILTEALAQTAGIAVGGAGRMFYLAAIKGMKFPQRCGPGETIVLEAVKSGSAGTLTQCEVIARVGELIVAQGTLVLAEERPTAAE